MADIFDEVSEELKHDQLIKTWKKYSKFIIITILFIDHAKFFLILNFQHFLTEI